MFVAQEEIFRFNGLNYVCKKQPRKMWACQSCQLSSVCTPETFADPEFPKCRAKDRQDKTDVVFFQHYNVKSRRKG